MPGDNDSFAAAEKVLTGVKQANRAIHALFARLTRSYGLSFHQVFLLKFLSHAHGPMSLREVAEKMEWAKSTASVEVDRMVRAGLILRRPDPDCRRQVLIELSSEGRSLGVNAPKQLLQLVAGLLSELPAKDLAEIEAGLERLNAFLGRLSEVEVSAPNTAPELRP